MLRRTIPSIFIIMALVFLFSCSGSADKPDVAVESITLDSTEITLKAGETATLKATVSPEDATDKSLLWTSDSESITVEAGVVTVSSTATAGEYTITVTSVSNTTVKAACTVTVEAAAAGGGGGGGGGGSPSGGEEAQPEPDKEIDIDIELKPEEGSGESPSEKPTQTVVSEPITIDQDVSVIKLTNLESGKMYTLYPEKNEAQPPSKAFSAPLPKRASRSSSNLNSLSGGTYIFTVPEGQTEFTFHVEDMNLTAGDAFRVGKVAESTISFTEADAGSIVIQQGKDKPIFTRKTGAITHEIYEKFFKVSLSDVKDKEHIALLNPLDGLGSASASTNFEIIDEYGNSIVKDKKFSILDFSNHSSIYVYMKMEVISEETNWKLVLYLRNPPLISEEKEINLAAPNIYMFDSSSVDRIVEISFLPDVQGFGSSGFNNDVNARYASTGERHQYFYPISFEPNKILMNLAPNENDSIIFDYEYSPKEVEVTAKVRNRTDEDPNAKVIYLKSGENKIVIEELEQGKALYPMVFFKEGTQEQVNAATIDFTEVVGRLRIVSSHDDNHGYSNTSLPHQIDGTLITREVLREKDYLEYIIYEASNATSGESISFTITVPESSF